MELAPDQALMSTSWHRPEPFSTGMLTTPTSGMLGPGSSTDMAANMAANTSSDPLYRHHMDTSRDHTGYFNSRSAMHGLRSPG